MVAGLVGQLFVQMAEMMVALSVDDMGEMMAALLVDGMVVMMVVMMVALMAAHWVD